MVCLLGRDGQVSSILFGDTMVPSIEQEYILLLGIVSYWVQPPKKRYSGSVARLGDSLPIRSPSRGT